ncbi:hypothetical protein [Yoonia sp.]|uniref:hypothetical protein n=1 Tax=Yoonia sp. TaxID=2212373 RepID=UPI003A4DE060|nr:hypothetical protein [Loktanella sp.]
MKHPLDRAKAGSDTGLSRVIEMKKDALPRPASLDLQKRSRSKMPGKRAAEFLRIARQETR